jgi:hypothetical protein
MRLIRQVLHLTRLLGVLKGNLSLMRT